jgi:phosphoribosylanthranilate isomerase
VTRIKLCGIATLADLDAAIDAGADALGFIRATSPRKVDRATLASLAAALPPFVDGVAVFADSEPADVAHARALGLTLQFSGHESAATCEAASDGRAYVKAFHVTVDSSNVPSPGAEVDRDSYARALWMFDSTVRGKLGGTGIAFDWERIVTVARARRVIVSGGLTPENVAACVRTVRPYAVDVRSGVESDGRKDYSKMCAFVRAVREADEQA